MKGHCLIIDELGNTILDKSNAIHPSNMAQIIARALSNDSNYWINSIAFGNGGCDIISDEYIPRTLNDGIVRKSWDDNLYNEIYRIYLDQVDLELDTGYDDVPLDGQLENSIVSLHPKISRFNRNKQGIVSFLEDGKTKIEILVKLENIPNNQFVSGGVFTFDEIALYSGITLPKTRSVQKILYNVKNIDLIRKPLKFYANVDDILRSFDINTVNFVTQLNDLLKLYRTTVTSESTLYFENPINLSLININKKLNALGFEKVELGIVHQLTVRSKNDNLPLLIDYLKQYTPVSIEEDSYLIFESNIKFSIVNKYEAGAEDLFVLLLATIMVPEYTYCEDNSIEEAKRLSKNDPLNPENEIPRLLTHLTFEPIDKPAMSNYYLIYTLEIDVDPTPEHTNDFVIPNDYRLGGTYEYNTVYPLKEWNIFHQLGYIPKVKVFVDNKLYNNYAISYGNVNTENAASNQLTIVFDQPIKGTARME